MSRDLSWLRTLPSKPLVVAEVKPQSPYGWVNRCSIGEQIALCNEYGDIISVHTDPLWGGWRTGAGWSRTLGAPMACSASI